MNCQLYVNYQLYIKYIYIYHYIFIYQLDYKSTLYLSIINFVHPHISWWRFSFSKTPAKGILKSCVVIRLIKVLQRIVA